VICWGRQPRLKAMRDRSIGRIKKLALDALKEVDSETIRERLRPIRPVSKNAADYFAALAKRLCVDDSSLERFSRMISAFLLGPDPEGSLLNLIRYLDATTSTVAFLNMIADSGPMLEMLAVTFGSSRYMADIIIRNPGLLYWLIAKSTWEKEDTVDDLVRDINDEIAKFNTRQGKLDALKRFHRKMILKIGVQDLLGERSMEKTTAGLSDLAEAVVRVVLDVASEESLLRSPDDEASRGGGPRFCVIAMCKLGGRELNYSSDIDLVYICDNLPEKEHEAYHHLAERLTADLSEATDEGYLYRVDLRLRPDGTAGPIVNTLASMRIYYEQRGRPWEFQAYLKARPVAGDLELGRKFLRFISGLIYNPSSPYSPVADISLLRERIQESITFRDKAFNVKLMEGGIRDIEFIVQTLQLLHGSTVKAIRVTNTTEAVGRLLANKLIKKWEADILLQAYRFLRLVEHRLQMMHQLKTHTIPRSENDMRLLAERVSRGPLGRFTMEQFLESLTSHLNKIRIMSDSFFAGKEPRDTSLLLVLPAGDRRVKRILARYGIEDARRALDVIHNLAFGSFPDLLDRRARIALEDLLPRLLEETSLTGEPTRTLAGLAKISRASGNERSFYRFMHDEDAMRRLLVAMAGTSSLMAARLSLHPEVIDSLMEDPEEHLKLRLDELPAMNLSPPESAGKKELAAFADRLKSEKHRIELAAFAVDLKRGSLPDALSHAMAVFATRVAGGLFQSLGCAEKAALFALGSYGVGEPRPASDMDLIVVARPKSGAEQIEHIARKVRLMNEILTGHQVLKLDFRLRGEGANAPLLQDLDYYTDYFARRMSPWERIALAKCSFVCGSKPTADAFLGKLASIATRRFSPDEVTEILEMRAALEAKVKPSAATWETKRSRGGRYDIEYMCGVGLAASGFRYEDLGMNTKERIDAMSDMGLIDREERDSCRDAVDLFTLVEFLMELQEFPPPRTKEQRNRLNVYMKRTLALLGKSPAGSPAEELILAKTKVREAFENAFRRLG